MRLRTPRLVLNPLAVSDAVLIGEALRDPALYRYLPQPIPADEAEVRALVARWSGGSRDPDLLWMNWIGVETATLARVGLFQVTIEPAERTARIGYIIFTAMQHRGFGREGVGALVADLEAREDVDVVLAEITRPHRVTQLRRTRSPPRRRPRRRPLMRRYRLRPRRQLYATSVAPECHPEPSLS
jgi:RimJ/RimL family protein N-acetyltransferase